MQMRLYIGKLGVVSSYMVISGRRWGGDIRTHSLPLTGIYKGIVVHVLTFYKSENICAFAKSSICAYVHFRKKYTEILYMRPQVIGS